MFSFRFRIGHITTIDTAHSSRGSAGGLDQLELAEGLQGLVDQPGLLASGEVRRSSGGAGFRVGQAACSDSASCIRTARLVPGCSLPAVLTASADRATAWLRSGRWSGSWPFLDSARSWSSSWSRARRDAALAAAGRSRLDVGYLGVRPGP